MGRARSTKAIVRSAKGVTAIELLVVCVILGVIAATVMLRQQPISASFRAQAAARQVLVDLRLARSKALQHNTAFRVTFLNNGTNYSVERLNPSTNAWESYGLYTHGPTALSSPQPIPLPDSVTSANAYTVRFLPRGEAIIDTGTAVRLRTTGNVRSAVAVTVAGAMNIVAP